MDYVRVVLAEESLRSRADAKSVLKLLITAVSYPCNLRSKALNVILFLLEKALRDEHRHTNILVTCSLEHTVEDTLHILPYSVAIRTYYHTALNTCIFYQLCFFADICVPLSKILVH